jgi:hypothetical protein
MGAFLVEKNAVEMKEEQAKKGYEVGIVLLQDSKQKSWYVVGFSKATDRENAEKICRNLKEQEKIIAIVRSAGKL